MNLARNFTVLLFLTLAGIISTCQHAIVHLDSNIIQDLDQNAITNEIKIEYWLWGLRPSPHIISADDLCPGMQIVRLHEYSSLTDGLLENFTLGIYGPKRLEATCL